MKFAYGGIDFLLLWLIPAAMLAFVLLRARRASRAELLIRFLTISAILIAILQPYVEHREEFSKALLLLDISDSMDDAVSQELLNRVRSMSGQGLEVNILPFAGTAADLPVADDLSPYRKLKERYSSLNIGKTNVEQALRNRASVSGLNALLISDGFETLGNARNLFAELRAGSIHVFPVTPASTVRSEEHAHVAQLTAPLIAPLNKSAEIRATLVNPADSDEGGTLVVHHENQVILSSFITVPAGRSVVVNARSDPSKEGIKEITATFRPDSGFPVSMRTIYLSSETPEKILLVSGTREDERFLAPLLSRESFQLKALAETEAENLPPLSDFGVVIFNNVSRVQLPDDTPRRVEQYVQNGGGFVMVGGERSFGLGEYRHTEIESVLPVRLLPPQSKQKRLNIAVELVVDKSKSMAEDNRVEFVKDAAREVVRNLKDDDLFGVTAFDTSPFVAVPLGVVSQIKHMAIDRISIIFPHGKTNLLPAMAHARDSLEKAAAGRKHMIILTDGDLPDSGPHYVEFVRQMRFSGITVSTVLIGPEFDRLLRQMGDAGGGAFYSTNDPQALPRIFLRDVKVRSGEETMKEQQEFEVRKGPGTLQSTTLKAFPPLSGFVQTQQKESANQELVITSQTQPQSYPLLSSWIFGKGRSVAFTSDANGRWSKSWIEWTKFRQFWDEVISSAKPGIKDRAERPQFDLRYGMEGGSLVIDAVLINSVPGTELTADLVFPDSTTRSVEFRNTAKARFRSEIRDPLPGRYEFRGRAGDAALTPVAFEISGEYFGEKKGKGFNVPLLEALAGESGGRVNPLYQDIKASKVEKVEKQDLSVPFIMLAFALFALEIAWRELWEYRKRVLVRKRTPRTPHGLKPLIQRKRKSPAA